MINVFVTGKPRAQPRARKGKYGKFYNPGTAVGWQEAIINTIRAKCPGLVPIDEPTQVEITYYFLGQQGEPHTKKPDIDNLNKAILDALQAGNIITDDKLIYEIHATKLYSNEAGMMLDII